MGRRAPRPRTADSGVDPVIDSGLLPYGRFYGSHPDDPSAPETRRHRRGIAGLRVMRYGSGRGSMMKLVRSDSPEVVRAVASADTLACWGSSTMVLLFSSTVGLLIALVLDMLISVRAAVWVGVPVFVALNVFYLWRSRSPRLNWVVAIWSGRVYIRLFVKRGNNQDGDEPNVMILEHSEIASIAAKTIDVYLYGPKPKVIEWLVIEPADPVRGEVFDHISPLQPGMPNLCGIRPIDAGKQVLVGNEEGPLTIEWRWCRPALRTFLQQIALQCPSMVIPEQRSELDLNGIWHGFRRGPTAEQRRMLLRAKQLGFGSKCVQLLSLYRFIPLREARGYLDETQEEEARIGI